MDIRWYFSLDNDEKSCLLKSKIITKNNLIVYQQCKIKGNVCRRYTLFEDYISFWNYYLGQPPELQTFNEICLENQLQKMRFDLDMKGITDEKVGNEMVEQVMVASNNFFKELKMELKMEKDWIVFTSHGKTKLSYHLIIDNYCFQDCSSVQYVYNQICKELPTEIIEKYLDNSIYSKNHSLRIYGNSKIDEIERIKQWNPSFTFKSKKIKTKLEIEEEKNELLEDYSILQAGLVTCTENCKVIKITIPKNEVELGELEQETVDKALELLKTIDEEGILKFYKIEGNFICLKKDKSYHCPTCEKTHESENPYLLLVGDTILFNCRRNQKNFVLGKGIKVEKKTIEIEEDRDMDDNRQMRKLMGQVSVIPSIQPSLSTG